MLHTGKRLLALRAPWRRAYSVQPPGTNPYPFHNLRAYPFKMSPRRAQNLLAPFASLLLGGRNYIQSLLSFLFRDSDNFSPIRPTRLQPVYFPGWILDVELQGQVTIKGDNKSASAQIRYAYVPGSDYEVLSSACLAPVEIQQKTTVPFSNDLLRQHDLDIACIPYNISPFSILDIAGHLSCTEITIEPNLRFIPSTVKAELFAAYPILLPVYLAQYEVETTFGPRLHTLFIEAYGDIGDPWSEPFFGVGLEAQESLFKGIQSLFNLPLQDNRGAVNLMSSKPFARSANFSLAPDQPLSPSLCRYINMAMNLPGAATALAAASVQDFDQLANDQRIREFTPKERNPVIMWQLLGSKLAMLEWMYEFSSKSKDTFVINPGQNPPTFDKLLDEMQAVQAERVKYKPHWAKTPEGLERESPRRHKKLNRV